MDRFQSLPQRIAVTLSRIMVAALARVANVPHVITDARRSHCGK